MMIPASQSNLRDKYRNVNQCDVADDQGSEDDSFALVDSNLNVLSKEEKNQIDKHIDEKETKMSSDQSNSKRLRSNYDENKKVMHEFREQYQNQSCKQSDPEKKESDDHFFDDLPKTKKRSTTDPEIFLQEQERKNEGLSEASESCQPAESKDIKNVNNNPKFQDTKDDKIQNFFDESRRDDVGLNPPNSSVSIQVQPELFNKKRENMVVDHFTQDLSCQQDKADLTG